MNAHDINFHHDTTIIKDDASTPSTNKEIKSTTPYDQFSQ